MSPFQVKGVAAYLDARPVPEARLARLRKVFKLGAGQDQGGKKGKKQGKGPQGQAEEGPGDEKETEEDLEHAIISRIAAKHVL
jgi:hypothetical protein